MRILVDYRGIRIRLTDERSSHIRFHREMEGLDEEIASALRYPECVVRSRSDESVSLYYRYLRETVVGAKWLSVVVKKGLEDSFILTAYLTDKVKEGETLWPSE